MGLKKNVVNNQNTVQNINLTLNRANSVNFIIRQNTFVQVYNDTSPQNAGKLG
jgi:hypothetical protein